MPSTLLLLEELLARPSVTPDDAGCQALIAERLRRLGFACESLPSGPEGAVVANYRRKEADAERMAAALVLHRADLSSQSVRGMARERPDYSPTEPMIIPSWLGEAA